MQQTTIAAIATAPVKSGLGVIRISGPEALRVAGRVFQCKNRDRKLADMPGHTVCYGVLSDRSGQLDDGVATVFRGPRSYTGEDVVEFSCHGGIYSLKKSWPPVLTKPAPCASGLPVKSASWSYSAPSPSSSSPADSIRRRRSTGCWAGSMRTFPTSAAC